MHHPPPPSPDDLELTIRLELQLRRSHPGEPWSAEIALPGTSGRLAFPTLALLFGYLSRLERPQPPPAGLR
jgi:hypothetical protein